MTKNEFISKLRNALSGLSEKDREDVLEDFEEHFNDAIESGKTEEEICKELGEPQEIARMYNEEIKNETKQNEDTNTESTESTINTDNIDEVEVNTDSADINVIFEDRSDIYVKSSGRGGFTRSIYGNRMVIEAKRSTTYTRFFNISFSWDNCSLYIYMPANSSKKLSVQTKSGDIRLTGTGKLSDLFISTLSGDIDLPEITVNSVRAKTLSGDIVVNKIDANDTDIHSTSGDVSIESITGNSMINSTSGDINVNVSELKGNMSVSMISGDGYLKLPKNSNASFSAKTISGDIRCDFPVNISNGFVGESVSGVNGSGLYFVKVTSTSGDIRIRAL